MLPRNVFKKFAFTFVCDTFSLERNGGMVGYEECNGAVARTPHHSRFGAGLELLFPSQLLYLQRLFSDLLARLCCRVRVQNGVLQKVVVVVVQRKQGKEGVSGFINSATKLSWVRYGNIHNHNKLLSYHTEKIF